MPQKSQDNMKGTSPSKLINQGINTAWGAQNKGGTDPKKVLAQKYTDHPCNVPKGK
jgi:hypothetical protein